MSPTGKELHKTLGTKEVFSIAAGAMISSGLFVLPAVTYLKAGPAILAGYILASLFVIPSMLAKAELATAMPRSGGDYFFIDRSFGTMLGSFTGFAAWFSLSLKSAFALVGIGIFMEPLFPAVSPHMVKLIAVAFTLIFTVLNLLSVKESGRAQVIMVGILLFILVAFTILGFPHVDLHHLQPFSPKGGRSLFLITGMIFISFGGLTKVASVAEEIKDPARAIPAGMFGAFGVVSLLYFLTIFITLGVLTPDEMAATLTPLSSAAAVFLGRPGFVILALAAMLAFVTTANAGLMAASRSPMAMSRDGLLPACIGRVSRKHQTPVTSILLTSLFMISCIVFLEVEDLVKVASTMKLLMFLFGNISVILMRQSGIVSYRPSFKTPLYPYLPLLGIFIYIALILQMGRLPLILTLVFFVLTTVWYFIWNRGRESRKSAFVHMVENLTNKEIVDDESELEAELFQILRDRDEIKEDRFDSIIAGAPVMDMDRQVSREEFFAQAAALIGKRWDIDPAKVEEKLQIREEQASTLIYPGVAVPHAIPHIIIEGERSFDIILVRNKKGIVWNEAGDVVYTAFCLVGSKDERHFHLKALMSIAQILQDPEFHGQWHKARTAEEMRSVILLTKRRRS